MRLHASSLLAAIVCSVGIAGCEGTVTARRSPDTGLGPAATSPNPLATVTALDGMALTSQAPVVVEYKPIDLATLPEPIGTLKPPTRDWTGAPLVQPTAGGLPFDGFSFAESSGAIMAVASLGAPSLKAASQGVLPATKGTLRQVLQGTVMPVVRDWAADGVMVAALGIVDNDGIGPAPHVTRGITVPAVGWIVAFQSVQRNEALLFAVDEAKTRVVKLTFATPVTPIKPGVSGPRVDSDALLATVGKGMKDLKLALPDAPFVYAPDYSVALGKQMVLSLRQRAAYAERMATRSESPEPDTGTYADSRWWVFLHRDTSATANEDLAWYVQLQPGPSSTGSTYSELFGGFAKVDARTGNPLVLMHPWRSNPKAYRAGPSVRTFPGPPYTVPTPTSPPSAAGPIPTPVPTPIPLPSPMPTVSV